MPGVAAFVRGWFAEPPPPFELREASARWARGRPQQARRALRVAEVIKETPSTRSFVLASPDGGAPALARPPYDLATGTRCLDGERGAPGTGAQDGDT